jgi:hypothetical protein
MSDRETDFTSFVGKKNWMLLKHREGEPPLF